MNFFLKTLLYGTTSIFFLYSCRPTPGCTDKTALNYEVTAEKNNGSCKYCVFETAVTSNNKGYFVGNNSSEPFFGDSILAFDMIIYNEGFNDISCDNRSKSCSIVVKIINLTNQAININSITANYFNGSSSFSFFNSGPENEVFYIAKWDTVYPTIMPVFQDACGAKLLDMNFSFGVSYSFN